MNEWEQIYTSVNGLGPLLQMLYDLSARVDQIEDVVSPYSDTRIPDLDKIDSVRQSLRNTQARIRRVELMAETLNKEVVEFSGGNQRLGKLNQELREKLGKLREENNDLREELATFQQREIERLSASNKDLEEHLELKGDGVYGRFKGLDL